MNYATLRQQAKTGDILAVKGTGFIGGLIRALTGESYSHVALLVWDDGGLMVYEFVEGTGYQAMPASEWLRRRTGQRVHYGIAPRIVGQYQTLVAQAARRYRNSSVAARWYGWFSLPKVWFSQLIGRRIPVRQKVCSTFVQECWQAGKYAGLRNSSADPGSIVSHCDVLHKLTTPKGTGPLS